MLPLGPSGLSKYSMPSRFDSSPRKTVAALPATIPSAWRAPTFQHIVIRAWTLDRRSSCRSSWRHLT